MDQRTEIATRVLAAICSGMVSSSINAAYMSEFIQGVHAAPKLAVQLADSLLEELSKNDAPADAG